MQKPIICLMGPTASGKTQLAVELVRHFPFDIISVDSAMVYRGMNIGTAKPGQDILTIAPHRLIDIRDPADAYSAAQFREDAVHEIEMIFAEKKIPLLVGGTMLYFRALQKGLSDLPSADPVLRDKLRREGIQQGWPALHKRLAEIDEAASLRIHPHDSQRIQRALEVYELTGKNVTTWQQENRTLADSYHIINLVVAPAERSVLHVRIAERFESMLASGLVDEVRDLFARQDLTLDTPAIRSVGYRQVWEYLLGHFTWDEMREKGIIATRQLAKRQLTWLRHWPNVEWFDSDAVNLFDSVYAFLIKKIQE